MAQVKEYYPSLSINEYKLGEFCMFIRNTTFSSKKIGDQHKEYISNKLSGDKEGGLEADWEDEGGLAPENMSSDTEGGLEPDTGNVSSKEGGLERDTTGKDTSTETFDKYNKKRKKYGLFSYEAGRIIGVNKKDNKIYVQFAETEKGYCHIFKAGIPSDQFDRIDKLIQEYGK